MKLIDESSAGVSFPKVLGKLQCMARLGRTAIPAGGTFAIFAMAYMLIDIFAFSSVARIVVDMESERETVAAVYYSSNLKKTATFQEDKVRHLLVKAGVRATYNFDLDNKVVRKIRLDPGEGPGTYRVYSLSPRSFYGKIEEIYPFLPEVNITPSPGTSIAKKDGYLEVIATTSDPYLIFDGSIRVRNPLLRFAAPLVVTMLVLVAIRGFQLTACAFWTDTIRKLPSGGRNYDALDGLRGCAALCVLAAHTGLPGCNSLGHVGVVIFFCLSGFLLSLPYARNGELILSPSNIRSFYLRRLRRIVPMFYFILILTYLFNGRIETFIRSMLFIQGNSILWTVLQEIHFYIFLPLVLLLNHFVLRGNRWLIVTLFLALGYSFNHGWLSTYEIFAMGQYMVIHAGIFLTGIMMGYLCQIQAVRQSRVLRLVCANPLVAVLLLAAVFGIEQLWAITHDGQIRKSAVLLSGNFNYLVGGLIGMLVLAPHSFAGRLFTLLPLRLIGTVSYSFYLLHPICLKVAKTFATDYLGHPLSTAEAFLSTLALTWVLSCLTYTCIERTFLQMKTSAEGAAIQPSLSPR